MEAYKRKGFTIVELLIVIVVIAILAAISIVAYNGIQDRARNAATSSAAAQAARKLSIFHVGNQTYPDSLSEIDITDGGGVTYDYYPTPDTNATSYCLTVTSGNSVYTVNNTTPQPAEGDCATNYIAGWWKFNGDATDSSGNNNNGGLIGGPTLATGANGDQNSAYEFSTSIQRISAGVPAIQRNMTLSAWIYPTSYPTERSAIIQASYYLSLASDGSLQSYWYGTSPAGYHSSGSNTVPLNQWSYVVATWNGVNAKLYVNGNLMRTVAISGNGNTATGISIGAQSSNRQFLGRIDDVRIYNRALNEGQIINQYNSGAQ